MNILPSFRPHRVMVCFTALLLACVLVAPVALFAAEPSARQDQESPDGEIQHKWTWVPSATAGYPDPVFRHTAEKVHMGQANDVDLASYFWLLPRLYPFTVTPPAQWRQRVQDALCQPRPASAPRREDQTGWFPLGPFGMGVAWGDPVDTVSGRATALWFDPADKNHVLLGTADGGVWATTDQGLTWTSLFEQSLSQSVGSIAVDPGNSRVVYVGTGEGNFNGDGVGGVGIYKSTDGGASWTLLPLPAAAGSSPAPSIRRIAIDPRDTRNIYAASDVGILYSSDGGASWDYTHCGATGSYFYATDVVLDSVTPPAGSPSLVYMAFGSPWQVPANGVYRSAAGGPGPWTKISTGGGFPTASVGRITLVQAPSAPKQIYALIEDASGSGSDGRSLGVWVTTDASAASVVWTPGSKTNYAASQAWYDMTGTVDPTNPAHLIVGGLDDYLSADNGGSLARVSSWTGTANTFSHADHHFLAMPDATTLYDANDGGFFVGTVDWNAHSVDWVSRNAGLNTLQFYGMAQHPTDPAQIIGGLQDNGEAYMNGSSWNEVAGGDGGKSAWDFSDPKYAYEEYVYSSISQDSVMTTDPTNWQCVISSGCPGSCWGSCDRAAFIAPLVLDANDADTLYAGTYRLWAGPGIRMGGTWAAISPDLTAGSWDSLNVIHSARNGGHPGTIYTGSYGGRAMVTRDGGTTWTDITASLPNLSITGFATDPSHGNNVLVTFSGYYGANVSRSQDGGTTWTDITGNLPPQPYNAVALDPSDVNHAYAGSDFGVFENLHVWSSDQWLPIPGLPAVSVQEFAFNPANGHLRAATHGRGVWELGPRVVVVPAVTSVSPAFGTTTGGTSVTISGSGFTGATSVFFGGKLAASFSVASDTQISATSPDHIAGRVDVTVTGPGGTSPLTGADYFTFLDAPAVSAIDPTSGSIGGGTAVTVLGSGFTGATSVFFGGKPAAGYSVASDAQITATSPVHIAGRVDVTVTGPGGTSATTSADYFTFVDAPIVSSVAPAMGPTAGGTPVTISGSGFTGATAVSFGGSPAANFSIVSATQITAYSPVHAAGIVDVIVTAPSGTSAAVPADQFTFVAPPLITSLTPATGCAGGGTSVVIVGTGFTGTSAVSFGGTPAASFVANSNTQITAVSPAHAPGGFDAIVTAPGGTSAVVASDWFTVDESPVITSVQKLASPFRLILAGTSFVQGCSVTINGQAVSGVSWKSAGKIVLKGSALKTMVPKGQAVSIAVVNPDGCTSAPFMYTR